MTGDDFYVTIPSVTRHNEEGHGKARQHRHIAQDLQRQCIKPGAKTTQMTTAHTAAPTTRHAPRLIRIRELLLLLLVIELANILGDAFIVRGLHEQIVQLNDKE